MPLYKFRCRGFGRLTEALLHHVDNASPICPHCGGSTLEKLFPASQVLRGGGRAHGSTCCVRTERCEAPPFSSGEGCRLQ